MKKIYFTSDLHLFHANSIVFDQRPFRDLNHMHESLVRNYNATVPENGICYFLGDIGFGNNESIKEIISQLNGTKVCVLGNHDKNVYAMYSAGFDVVLHGAVIYIANQRVTMSHCPLLGLFREDVTGMRGAEERDNWHGERKHGAKHSFTNEGQFHLSGHIHSGSSNNKQKILGRQYDVGVCANNYKPVSYSKIESWIALTIQGEKKINEQIPTT